MYGVMVLRVSLVYCVRSVCVCVCRFLIVQVQKFRAQ